MRRLILTALLLTGCTPDFDPASFLEGNKLRVLGVVADPPDVPPGGRSTLRPIVAAIPPGSSLTYAWALCKKAPPPGSGGVNKECVGKETADFLQPLAGVETAEVTMPPFTNAAMFGLPDATTGLYLPVRLILRAGEQQVIIVYRLRVSVPGFVPNTNPVLEDVQNSTDLASPTSIPADAGVSLAARSKVKLRALLTEGSLESFVTLVGDPRDMIFEANREKPRFFWYSDAGEFSEEVTGVELPDNTLDLGSEKRPGRAGDTVNVWVVVHDERGGTAVAHRQLHLE